MNIQEEETRKKWSLKKNVTQLLKERVTQLVDSTHSIRGVVTGSGLEYDQVYVTDFLRNKLVVLPPSVIESNDRLKKLVCLCLGNDSSAPMNQWLSLYLATLSNKREVSLYDLKLCASILGGNSLQLPDGDYYQVSRVFQ